MNTGFPKGPKFEKVQDRPAGLKFSSETEHLKRATRQPPTFCGGIPKVKIVILKPKD